MNIEQKKYNTPEQALQKTLGFGAKTFIEKAIEGGWSRLFMDDEGITVDLNSMIAWGRTKTGLGRHLPIESILLDPLAWQAAGRVEGWTEDLPSGKPSEIGWKMVWHRFIDTLTEEV